MQNTIEKPRASSVTLKLGTSQRDRIKSLAFAKKRTSHYIMKEAIERYLKTEEAQQVILSSIDDSIAHFEATGLHINHNEVKAWAKQLETNRNAKLPECHS